MSEVPEAPAIEAVANAPKVEPAAIRSELDIEADRACRHMFFASSVESKLLWAERYVAALKKRRAAK